MAKQIQKNRTKTRATVTSKKRVKWNFPLTKKNFIIAAIGLAVILLGFLLMATGITEDSALPDGKWNNVFAISIAPILLVIGYCILIPLAIIKFFGKKDTDTQS